MTSESLNLFRLQKLDTLIDKHQLRIAEIKQILSRDQRVRKATALLEKAQAQTKEIRIQLRQLENKVKDLRIKRETTQASMFSGKIKNPKQLEELQMETEALKRYINQLEDEQLEIMIAYESAEDTEQKAEKRLNQIKATTIQENAEMQGERKMIEANQERLLREKDAVLQSIPPENLTLYQRLRKAKYGTAVAAVTDGGCSICGQALTPADQQSIRASNRLVFCPSCGRILFEG
jgi:predicted  nucleic acid-binding Zn-ribbon protein